MSKAAKILLVLFLCLQSIILVWVIVGVVYYTPEEQVVAEPVPAAPQEVYITINMDIEGDQSVEEIITLMREWLDTWNVGIFESTAYAPHDPRAVAGMCHDGDPTSTRTGTYPSRGTIAVNPHTIPYYTNMWVDGYGWGKALDTGGAMRKNPNLIDLFVHTQEEIRDWGRREVLVIYENPVV